MSERPYIGVAVILCHGTRVLLGKRIGNHGGGCWSFPGGHLEFMESPISCARRELLEETGLTAEHYSPGPYTNDFFNDTGRHYVTLFFLAHYSSGEPQVMEPLKCAEWRWFERSELPSPLFLPIRNLLASGAW